MSLKRILPAIFWGVIIFWVISAPQTQLPDSELLRLPLIDKVIHFILFFVFSVLLAYGLNKSTSNRITGKPLIIIILSIGLLYGAITELFQFAVLPDREGSVFDFIANAFGTIFGLLFFRYCTKPKKTGNK